SPFFTRPRGAASLTETTMMSPTPATRRFDPPSTLMHWTRLAPLLSATSRLDCIWIIVRPLPSQIYSGARLGDVLGLRLAFALRCLGRFRRRLRLRLRRRHIGLIDFDCCRFRETETLDDSPALGLRNRRAFLDPHLLADVERIVRVMRVILLRAPDDLSVQRVLHPPLDTDDNGLVALVGDHGADQDTLGHSFLLLSPALASGRVGSAAS